jgi:hypothetical protein
MNPKLGNRVMSVATLRGEPRKRSTPEVRDQCRVIPLRRKLAFQKSFPVVEPVPILEENRRRKRLPGVINLRNLERPNHPPSVVR